MGNLNNQNTPLLTPGEYLTLYSLLHKMLLIGNIQEEELESLLQKCGLTKIEADLYKDSAGNNYKM